MFRSTLYIDDILLPENNLETIETTKKWFPYIFEMKDMGEVKYLLGVEIIFETITRRIDLKGFGTISDV